MTFSGKAVFDHSEDELKAFYRANAKVFPISQDDILREPDRRASRRQARASFVLSAFGLLIAVVAVAITAIKA
jgi:hypothetical protein